MTITVIALLTAVRSVLVASCGLLISCPATRAVSRSSDQRWRLVLFLIPLLIPDLLIGFFFRPVSESLVQSTLLTETMYAGLLWWKVVGIQTATGLLIGSGDVTPSALHLWSLPHRSVRSKTWHRLKLLLAGPWKAAAAGWLISALWCFQEFETAALLQVDQHPIAWSVWLFDAKAANEPLSNCLKYSALPLVIQGCFVLATISIVKSRGLAGDEPSRHAATRTRSRPVSEFLATAWAFVALVGIIVWPVLFESGKAVQGLKALWAQQQLLTSTRQLILSMTSALLSAVAALWLAAVLLRQFRRHWMWLILLPGLLSPLLLGLVSLKLFQWPIFRTVYDSWLPLIGTQVIWLLPRAVLLMVVMHRVIPSTALHSAGLLKSANERHFLTTATKIRWRLAGQRVALCLVVLTTWAFWEVTIHSLLHPVRFQPLVCRLYREMHFGHTEVLIALTSLAILLPLVLMMLAAALGRRLFR